MGISRLEAATSPATNQVYRSFAILLLTLLVMLLYDGAPASAQLLYDIEPVWADEFDGTEVDQTKWAFQIGDGCDLGLCGWGNNEKQWY